MSSRTPLRVGAHEVLVAHPLTVLGRVEQAERRKDRARAGEIERIRADVARGDHHLVGLDRLLGESAPPAVDGPSEIERDDVGGDGSGRMA